MFCAQAQRDDRNSGNFRNFETENVGGLAAGANTGGLADPTANIRPTNEDAVIAQNTFGLDQQSGNNQRQGTGARPNQFVVSTPEGPGIHAGFQARGPNYSASMSGGLKTSDGGAVETGVNLSGSFGDSNKQAMNAPQRVLGAQSAGLNAQGTRSTLQDEGATFAMTYKPGFLTALGNMFNPFRLIRQIGDAVAGGMAGLGQGMAGLTQGLSQGVAGLGQGIGQGLGQGLGLGRGLMGQASASIQAQSQYVPPQAQRSRNSDGVGLTWKPLYQTLPFFA